jgi:ribosomal protein L29
MATLKFKDLEKMNKEERSKRMEEMKFELVKARTSAAKSGSSKAKEIKKVIARILTLNTKENKLVGEKK